MDVPKEIAETQVVFYCSIEELRTARSLVEWGDSVQKWTNWFLEIEANKNKEEQRFVRLLVESEILEP